MTSTPTGYSVFRELIDSLKQAEGATSQLIHHAGNPVQFIMLRDALGLAIEGCMLLAPHNQLIAPKTVYLNKRRGA